MTPVTTYKCRDGRDFPVEWPSEEASRLTWFYETEHGAGVQTPLDCAVWDVSEAGAARARVEAGFPPAGAWGSAIWFHGFGYYPDQPPPSDQLNARQVAAQALLDKFGGVIEAWTGWCLPHIERSAEIIRSAGGDASLTVLIEEFGYAQEQTFLHFYSIPLRNLRRFCQEVFGDKGERLAVELLQGYPTATLEADQALWDLAQLAKRSPQLVARLVAPQTPDLDALRALADTTPFREAFDDYLERYGWRTEGWNLSSSSWRDRPSVPLALAGRIVAEDRPSPAKAVRMAAGRREALRAELLLSLGRDGEQAAELESLIEACTGYLTVKEARAHWQLSLTGLLGDACRRHGQRLVGAGLLKGHDQVFYLTPSEIDGDVTGDELSRLSENRRLELERWRGVVPPPVIGGDLEGEARRGLQSGERPVLTLLKGLGASRGRITAPARVLFDLSESERLRPGDVLVCVSTTPTWTPLFAIAGALITASGGLLSHPAIAAREYGIPAVVGVPDATELIRDGMILTVDGTSGEVRVEP